jgi:hypothetical protein
MEAKELMIGNWVYFGKKTCQIDCIRPHSVRLKGQKNYVSLDNIEPIPLTPLILEQNGFEPKLVKNRAGETLDCWEYRVDTTYFNEDWGHCLIVVKSKNKKYFNCYLHKPEEPGWPFKGIEHVHTLQNFMYLDGVLRDIENV